MPGDGGTYGVGGAGEPDPASAIAAGDQGGEEALVVHDVRDSVCASTALTSVGMRLQRGRGEADKGRCTVAWILTSTPRCEDANRHLQPSNRGRRPLLAKEERLFSLGLTASRETLIVSFKAGKNRCLSIADRRQDLCLSLSPCQAVLDASWSVSTSNLSTSVRSSPWTKLLKQENSEKKLGHDPRLFQFPSINAGAHKMAEFLSLRLGRLAEATLTQGKGKA